MNEKWLHDIHDRMANYEVDPPEGLWEGIEQRLAAAHQPAQSPRRRAAVVPLWARRAAGVAAMVAVAWLVGHQYLSTDTAVEPQADAPVLTAGAPTTEESPLPAADEASEATPTDHFEKAVRAFGQRLVAAVTGLQTPTYVAETLSSAADTASVAAENSNGQQAEKTSGKTEKTSQPSQSQPKAQQKSQGYTRQQPIYVAEATRRRGNEGRVSLSASTSGSTRGFSFGEGGDLDVAASGSLSDATWADSPILGLVTSNKGQHVETKAKHHMPARLGLTVAYNLTDRLALETGLTYACLSSELQSGSRENYLQTDQRLEYVGIPLNAKYLLLSYKPLQVYATAGVMAEKLVSGTADKTYVFDGATQAIEEETIDEHPLQFSTSASVGLQVSLSKNVGLYAEPGLRFNFADGSDLKTYYSAHPVNFNLNLGLRLSFGKQ